MHFDFRKAVGITMLPLLAGALAVGVAASPASAQTWQDNGIVASNLTQPTSATTVGATVKGVVNGSGNLLTYTAPAGQQFTAATRTGLTGSFDAIMTSTASQVVLGTRGSGTGTATLSFTIQSTNNVITCTARQTVNVIETGGVLSLGTVSSLPSEAPVTISVYNNSTIRAVQFSGTVTTAGSCALKFSQSNLPAGLTSGNPLVAGSAAPGYYTGLPYTATDPLGSMFSGTFNLRITASGVVPPTPPANYGNEVNQFGNGFDVYQQRQYPGAIIAGWTATKADPATHFLRLNGRVRGASQFEYAPHGAGTGLCVSDPGGGWASNPLPDGLILTSCNYGPWQQFIPQRNGTLKNVATGLVVSPNGKGAQLRGTAAPTSWGGSAYRWTAYRNLPR